MMMDDSQLRELLISISLKRDEMIYYAETSGLSEKKTVEISQELDNLIVHYQKETLSVKNKAYYYKK
ncbi:aspartyl-phosphate phosphatase Spo0E family protein [Bacillus sp. RG28]|uniref:Aspartyl-phosphate phosphatase Spo0E family protein n=2 Tax=Gottfriedia endophytica TaxID=2820819 RepID=A0A940SJX8_9BACI|nr:aspartyl-phosphate phosphatase Spo0E family protein [Gottfriedia endophytica]